MKTRRFKQFFYKMNAELQSQKQDLSQRIERWETEMGNAYTRLVQHKSISDNSAFRRNAMTRLQTKIEVLESRIETFELKREKISDCINHLPVLKKLAQRLISSSQLSYDFKQYYLPVYRQIAIKLNDQVIEENAIWDFTILNETTRSFGKTRRHEQRRASEN